MNRSAILAILAAAFACLPCTSSAGEEPEAVYVKFHRAAMAGDLDEMLKYGLAQRRAEMQGASAATREAALKLVQFMMPRAFKLESKAVGRNNRATLIVSGPWEGGHRDMDTVYGTVKLQMENGEWKVDETNWSDQKPPALAAARAAADKAAAKTPASAAGAPVIGSTGSGPPVHKLGEAKPECVYKPVMTAEDVERCK